MRHQATLLALAFKWIRILYPCWVDHLAADGSSVRLSGGYLVGDFRRTSGCEEARRDPVDRASAHDNDQVVRMRFGGKPGYDAVELLDVERELAPLA
jgi:hypothetical protein